MRLLKKMMMMYSYNNYDDTKIVKSVTCELILAWQSRNELGLNKARDE